MEIFGLLDERNLNFCEMSLLTDLCRGASEDRIRYLVTLYNQRSQSLERVEAHFVARYATQRGYCLYVSNGECYFGPANASEEIKKQFRIPNEAEIVDETKKNEINTYIDSPMEKATKMGFKVGYKKLLSNGNTEYILYNPLCNATMHFELLSNGSLDRNYDHKCFVCIPRDRDFSGEEMPTIISYYQFNEKTPSIITEACEKSIPKWPVVKLGKDHYFTSNENMMMAHENNMSHEQTMMFFSIMTLVKMHDSIPELQEIFGKENLTLGKDVIDVINNFNNYDCSSVVLKI